jgi:nondiscriminating glutamyl-tRNA synthetase
MCITHVLRGEEHLVNTPKQVLLYQALEFEPPRFAHLPLMLGKDKKKLSKRAGDVSLADYQAKGYPKEAIVNFLALQGWALDGETDVFSLQQLIERFDPGQVSKGGSIFDPDKFLWLAGEYLHADSVQRVAERCAPFVIAAGQATHEELEKNAAWYLAVVAQEQERIRLYSELPDRIAHWFAPDEAVPYDPKAEKNARKREDRLEILASWRDWYFARPASGPAPELAAATKAWLEEHSLPLPALFQPLRCVLTGLSGGPDLFVTILLLGPERARRRIESGIERLA